ncbi:MAG: GNAT family N-acetyltransferase [Desulfobacteraceae bacterium]|nr:MAG: GNAT family N-acetyltransferase [Desulfobacteraceae bacterium]
MITIQRIGARELESISGKWNAFIRSSTNDNIFLTYEWISSWWQSFKSDARTFYFLLACDSRQTIVGAFPFQIVRRRFGRLLHLRLLQFIGRGGFDHETEYNTFMMPPTLPGQETNVYAAVADYLNAHNDDWDVLILANLLATHKSTPVLESEFKKKFKAVRSKQENNYVIVLSQTYDAFLNGLSRNQRRSFTRRLKGIQKDRAASFSIITKEHEIENYLRDYYLLVHQRHNWTPSKEKEVFMKLLCRELARSGWLRCYLLTLNTIPSATIFGFCYNKKYYAYKAAYNPEFFSLSPGTALYAFAIQNEIAHGSEALDYLLGEYAYKQYWCNDVRTVDYIQIIGKSVKSRCKVFLAYGLVKIRSRLKPRAWFGRT